MQQPAYGQSYQTPQQYAGGPYGTAAPTVMDTQATYSYENARRTSVVRAYAEMTAGLAVTAVVAVLTQMTGALESFLMATGTLGWIGLAIVQVILAVVLGARVMSMRPATARVVFYLYAALMGFTLSSIFLVYDLGSIGLTLGLCVGFFFALTMLALTTKRDMLKAGPILMVALLVLVVGELILMFVSPSDTTLMVVSAIGLLVFAGLTAYDAQKTRALFASYAGNPEAIERLSILCALNLYLDFVNMFLYLLRLFGSRD
nr:Bax inhibitor-1/YccA family protein [uncultured Bifidobacterium sp.]